MKRIRLLLIALAVMVGMAANATDWTGSAVGAGTYYLYNVGAGQFLSYGGAWGTQAVVDGAGIPVKLIANGSAYQIETDVTGNSGKVFLGADFYIDQNACDFTFTEVAGKTNVYTLSYVSGTTTKYRNWVTGAKTFDQVNAVGSGSNYTLESCYWMLISENERNTMLANKEATESTPLNLTYKINNPNTAFYTGCYSSEKPWTVGVQNGGWAAGGRDNGSNWRDKCFEVWNKNFNNNITFSDMPKGKYRFSVTGFYRDGQYASGNNVQNAYIYANSQQVALQPILNGSSSTQLCSVYTGNDAWQNDATIDVNNSTVYYPNSQGGACFYFQAGKYAEQTVEVELESAGTLTIGVKKETTVSGDWTVVDKFQLFYLGDPDNPAPYKAERDALIASFTALEGTIPNACYNAINAVVEDNDDDYATIAEYETAIANINTAVSTYASSAIVANYTLYNTIKTAALALDDDATVFTGDATVSTTTADTQVEAATTVEGINSAIATLRGAASSFLGSVTVNDGKSFDITNVFITNPAPWASTDGWTCPVAATPNSSARAAEFWNKSGVSITQEMASLPAGYYTLKAQAFARTGCSPIYIFAGAADTDSSDDNIQELIKKSNSEISTMDGAGTWFDNGNGWNTFTYQNETAGSFTIGLKDEFKPNGSHGDNNDGWLIWREFGLLYLGTEPVSVLADLYADAKAAAEAARDNTTYANVAGAERAALLAAIADTPEATAESYKAKTSALIVATNSFIDDGVVLAWNNYANQFTAEVENAISLGMTSEAANAYAATSSSTSANATACVQNLKVAEYSYVTENYKSEVTIDPANWTTSGEVGTMTGQHWSGNASTPYYEQSSAAYNANSWSLGYTTTVSLPAGNYVFKVAGRKSSNNVTMRLTVGYGETNQTVSDFPNGNTGKGINTSGATDFTTGEGHTYANGGTGRGWEWRYVKFALDSPADVTLTITGSATSKQNWLGFCNATLLTDEADNVALIAALVELTEAKAAATLTQRTNKGTGVFQYNQTTDDDLWSAYTTAKSNAEAFTLAANTEVEDVTVLTTALNTAIANYNANDVLNAPAEGQRIKIVNSTASSAFDYSGKALTFYANPEQSEGGYGYQYSLDPNNAFAQNFIFTAVAGQKNQYTISFVDADGVTRYLCTQYGYNENASGDKDRIRTTTNSEYALKVRVDAMPNTNVWKLYNTEAEKNIGTNGKSNSDFFSNNDRSDLTLSAASQASVTVSCKAGKFGTVIFPFAPSVTAGSDVTFYTVTGVANDCVQLEEVAKNALVANTPYMIKNDGELLYSEELTGWGTANAASYESNGFTGVFTETTIPASTETIINYVLQTKPVDAQAFYKVTSAFTTTPYKCYLTVNSEITNAHMLKLFFDEDETTGINGLTPNPSPESEGSKIIYDLQGRKVQNPKRGMYIINGKKVVIK